jgi:hypothetical protein
VIVGNGNHVSQLTEARAQAVDPQLALRKLAYEPDPPIRTPRIAGAAVLAGHELHEVVVGSARSYPGAEEQVQHPSVHIARIEPGTAVMTTTYAGTAEQVVTDGQPRTVLVPTGWSSRAEALWGSDYLAWRGRAGLPDTPLVPQGAIEPAGRVHNRA